MPRQKIIANIKIYHPNVTDEYLENKSDDELLMLTHPIDRENFCKEMFIPFTYDYKQQYR